MKWKGIVSQLGSSPIATRFATANAAQAISGTLRRSQPIAAMSHRLDRCLLAEFLPQSSNAHLDHIRARVEMVAPHLRQQPLAADDLALVAHEMMQKSELAVRELRSHVAELDLPPRHVEDQLPGAHDGAVIIAAAAVAQLRPDPREQLIEGERLRDVVTGTEIEATQFRLEVGPCRDDHDRELGSLVVQLPQDGQPVQARQQQVEHDEVVPVAARAGKAGAAVARPVNDEPLRLQTARKEGEDSRLVLDDQDPHRSPLPTLSWMTWK